MSKNWKMAIILVTGLDVVIYLLLFHSGKIFPIINPSVAEYNQHLTSFPRDYMQKLLWLIFHWPSAFMLDRIAGARWIALSILQWPPILAAIGYFLSRRRSRRHGKGRHPA